MITSFYIFLGAIGVMVALGGLGIVGGIIHARIKEQRFLKIFNEDVKRPIVPSNVN